MFRASNSLTKAVPAWRNASLLSSTKSYSTPAVTPAVEKKQEQKPSLSARLGGSGRGKAIAEGQSADPFASFLANAKKPRTNNNNNGERRNGNFTPRPRKQQQDNGQFADAGSAEGANTKPRQPRQPRQPRAEGEQNNKPRYQRNAEGGEKTQAGDNQRPPRTNNNNNKNNNRSNGDAPRKNNNNRKMNLNKSQPQEVRTRRAVTFIDKDIDWASFGTNAMPAQETVTEQVKEDDALLLKEVQGDYDRYLGVGSDISWPQIINGANVGTLVGSNPTFDLAQKTAFLSALTNATSGAVSARK
ncbi:uncharacterized protein EV154DRAFT_492001 [Mucor mucedo]|uniref:uncharacterized protein n=1 Tax=Mucor mucedo TaxID=29922 RepID=UPI00221F7C34|nr:uncharacterized protein EV154DRAFT_492001 [Mucor mucedo]KAI7896361.1 hypothetical protein EV154DRAFT_492001 [Mucor mucedo]